MKTNDVALWEIIKDIITYIKYIFLSKERKFAFNLNLIQEKYWYQKLLENKPAINKVIEGDRELKKHISSRKKVRKMLRDKDERQHFKNWLEAKL